MLLWQDRLFGKRTEKMPPAQARETSNKFYQKVVNRIDYPAISMTQVTDMLIPMRDKHQIKVRIYKPSNKPGLPVIVYFHGGGFVVYNLESHDRVCRRIAKTTESIVVSVDYRLAPEFKFPVAAEDCYDSLSWTFANVDSFGGDLSNISVAGDSAGGNLATVVCLMSKEYSGPEIRSQILIYPTVDAT
ncbi:MAG: alpha/beta hydrolase, partial [Bacteroidia bacterium]|nr:alpha/beta hydrolase [Bacteroidia bacterium]